MKKSNLGLVLVRVSNVVTPWPLDSYKGKHFIGDALQFKGLVHCYHGGKHAKCRQTWCWELAGSSTSELPDIKKRMRHWTWLKHLRPQSPPQVTRFIQLCHTYLHKVIPPTSAIPHRSMGTIFIETTTGLNLGRC